MIRLLMASFTAGSTAAQTAQSTDHLETARLRVAPRAAGWERVRATALRMIARRMERRGEEAQRHPGKGGQDVWKDVANHTGDKRRCCGKV